MTDRITRVPPDRVAAAGLTLARAFADEPLIRWPLGDVADPGTAVAEEFAATAALADRYGCLWSTADGAGVAVWVDPEVSEAYWQELVDLPRGIAAHAADGGRRQREQWTWIAAQYPDEPAWVLDAIGVAPERQRGGTGGALLRHGLALAGAAGLPAYLETSRQELVGYYERFGFTVAEEGDVPGGGPHLWFMRAEPCGEG